MFYESGIFRKMIFSIIIVGFSFYGIGLFSNEYSKHTLSCQILDSLDARSNFFANQLENEANSLLTTQMGLSTDDNLLNFYVKLENLSNYQRTSAVRAVSYRLLNVKLLHSMVNNISVYLPNTKNIISSNTPIFDSYEQNEFFNYQRTYWQDESKLYLTTFFPSKIYLNSSETPCFYIRSEITQKTLHETLNAMLGDDSGLLLLMNENGDLIVSSGENGTEAFPVVKTVQEQLRQGKHTQDFHITNDGFASCIPAKTIGLWLVYCQSSQMVNQPLSFFVYLNIGLTILMLVLMITYAFYLWHAFAQPMTRIFDAMARSQSDGNLIRDDKNDELTVIYNQYNEMVLRLEALIHENYEAKYRAHMAELRQLQYQIRPHFLYNSIFLIYRMAKMDENESISEYARHLGSYYQYITRISDSDVLIMQEVEHVQHYLTIQKVRFGDRIDIQMDSVPEEVKDVRITPLLLQPIVENAYEHGLKSIIVGGKLLIKMTYDDGIFYFIVEDNGEGMTQAELEKLREDMGCHELSAEAHGLANTNLRLQLHYGKDSGLFFENLPKGGFRASVHIRLKGEGNV